MTLPDFLIQDRYGEIRLKGHRIGLFHIVFFHNRGESPDALVSRYPSLTPEFVKEVIAFYEANRDEVSAYIAECQAEIDRQRSTTPERLSLSELRRRRKAMAPESAP